MSWSTRRSLMDFPSGSRHLICTEERNLRKISRTKIGLSGDSRVLSRSINSLCPKTLMTTPWWEMIRDTDFSRAFPPMTPWGCWSESTSSRLMTYIRWTSMARRTHTSSYILEARGSQTKTIMSPSSSTQSLESKFKMQWSTRDKRDQKQPPASTE